MKRWIALLLALVACLSLCACGKKEPPKPSVTDLLRDEVEIDIQVYCSVYYENVRSTSCTMFTDDQGDGLYHVSGKATVIDNYGDKYQGNYDADYQYNEEDESFTQINFELQTPTKVS